MIEARSAYTPFYNREAELEKQPGDATCIAIETNEKKARNPMEARELYKQKYSAQIDEWSAKMDVLKAKVEQLGAQAKLDAKPKMDTAHSKWDAAKKKLDAIAEATEETWDDVVKEVDLAWEDFKASAEGAYDALKDHKDHKKS